MHLKNDRTQPLLVNGSRGVVIGFDLNGMPRVRFERIPSEIVVSLTEFTIEEFGKVIARRTALPLMLAWV